MPGKEWESIFETLDKTRIKTEILYDKVISIPSNIAEGAGRDSQKEFNQFLSVSLGSCFEIETQLILANEFNYISKEELLTLTEKVIKIQRMICKLKDSLMQPS